MSLRFSRRAAAHHALADGKVGYTELTESDLAIIELSLRPGDLSNQKFRSTVNGIKRSDGSEALSSPVNFDLPFGRNYYPKMTAPTL